MKSEFIVKDIFFFFILVSILYLIFYYDFSDVSGFETYFKIPQETITNVGSVPNSSGCAQSSDQNCGEATLDVQYLSGVGQNIPTTYNYDSSSNDGDFVSWITTVAGYAKPTNVYSISYGVDEVEITSSEITSFNTVSYHCYEFFQSLIYFSFVL